MSGRGRSGCVGRGQVDNIQERIYETIGSEGDIGLEVPWARLVEASTKEDCVVDEERFRVDFLSGRVGRFIRGARWFPVLFQVVILGVVLLLLWNGLGRGLDLEGAELETFRKTNLTTLLVWGIWWPSMIVVVVSFGRVWCTVCPLELVNRVADALARRVGWPRARLGKVVEAGWMVLAAYLLLQLLVAGASLHHVPHYTSLLLVGLLSVAFVTGLVFRHPRSFCRGFCPAGALLSVYGRHTGVQLEVRDPAVCAACEGRDCTKEANRYRFDGRSCPSLLRPYHRDPSDGCVLCFQCAKVCPHDNIGWGVVDAEAPIRRKVLLRPFEAGFVMVALGFVSHEVLEEVPWLDALFHRVPTAMASVLPGVDFAWLEAFWYLVLFPVAAWTVVSGLAYLLGYRGRPGSLILAAATGAAPVVAMAHLAKATAKIASWGTYLPLAFRDPGGEETFQRLWTHAVAEPSSLVSLQVVGWVMGIAALWMAWRAARWARRIPAEVLPAVRAGILGAALVVGVLMGVWAWPTA